MLPMPGCAEIFPARSRVSDEDSSSEDDVPGAGRVKGDDVRASIGRRGASMEKARGCEGVHILGISQYGGSIYLQGCPTAVVLLCG